jgi:hypothetical protein
MKSKKKQKRGAAMEKRRRQERLKKHAAGLVVIALAGLLIYNYVSNKTVSVGELGETMESTEHFPDGTLIEYSTSPPTSGPHYNNPMPAGFYDQDSPEATQLEYPHSYVVHSLEHGYVVLWYNCESLSTEECTTLKDEMRAVVDESPAEIIVFPYNGMPENVVITAWAIEHRFTDSFDPQIARDFIQANRNHERSPEPWAE